MLFLFDVWKPNFSSSTFKKIPTYKKMKLLLKTTSEEPKLCRNNDVSVQRFFINLVGSNQNKNTT